MHCVRHPVLLVAILLASASAARSSAQSPTTAAAAAGCTYATCALRVERSLFAERLVRGATAKPVSTLGVFGGGVEVLMSGSDSAAVHAQSYVWNAKRSAIFGGAGAIALATVLPHTQSGGLTNADVVTAIVGAVAAGVSVPYALRARSELSRAVWWYNGALPR